jgi:hypothetical protein
MLAGSDLDNRGMLTKNLPKLLTLGMMARRLRVPTKWLRAEAEAGRVPALPVAKGFLFDPDAVEAVLLHRARQGQEAGHAK